jgi:hypothetical protein
MLGTALAWVWLAMAGPQVVHSIDQTPKAVRTPEGAQTLATQLAGAPQPDGLGLTLPPGLSRTALVSLLAPPQERSAINAVGARPWPGHPGLFVAVACTGGALPKTAEDTPCATYASPGERPLKAYVAVVQGGGTPRAVAGPLQVDPRLDWRNSGLPSEPEALEDAPGGVITPTTFDKLDLAPYAIAPGQSAFGIRASWHDGYAGGAGEYAALYLFAPVNGRLQQVFAAPVSAFLMTAGSWHKDGTRDHEVTDAAYVLVVTSVQTGGHFDLLLKERKGGKSRRYVWSTAAGRYQPMG